MKVAQVTINAYTNYGNLIQKYALQKILEKFADFTEVLWFNGIYDNCGANFWVETAEISLNGSVEYYLREAVRLTKLKEFNDRHIKTRYNLPYIEEIADDYDFFVVGSDQVWNPKCEANGFPHSIRFLDFVPREKKIAYAPSIALKELPEEFIETWKQGISSFNKISVRESNSVDLIKKLTDLDAELLIDPALLLTPEEWLQVAQKPAWFNEKYERGYILTYFFDNIRLAEVQKLSKQLNLPIINLLNLDNFNHYITSLSEFLYLFANASVVYTNSFHGTAFSLLFKRPFVIYVKQDSWSDLTFERMKSITKMFGLENRITTSKTDYKVDSPLEIDFSAVEEILPLEREKAFNFLANALGVEVPQELVKGG